jgi:uncharacterized protein with HEPN domain
LRINRFLLEDILERAQKIELNSKQFTRAEIESDSNIYEAMLRHIEIIGEAVKNLPDGFKAKHAEVPLRQIGRTRDVLAHVYFAVSQDRIWNVIEVEIPKLIEAISKMIEDLPADDEGKYPRLG